MTSTTSLEDLAVVGRRVELALLRDKDNYLPGIVTRLSADKASVWIRLDGDRHNMPVGPNHPYLRYLSKVVPVPDLPMGPFTPTEADMIGALEGVLLSTIGEDGEDLVLLTGDKQAAIRAATAYDSAIGVDIEYVDYDRMTAHWVVFEWEPEDAEFAWSVRWDAEESDEHAVRVHYLKSS